MQPEYIYNIKVLVNVHKTNQININIILYIREGTGVYVPFPLSPLEGF